MLDALPEQIRGRIEEVADPSAAEWRLGIVGAELVLRQGPGAGGAVAADREVGCYPVGDGEHAVGLLALDLQKIYRWQNVWRIAGELGAGATAPGGGLDLEVRKLSLTGRPGGEPAE